MAERGFNSFTRYNKHLPSNVPKVNLVVDHNAVNSIFEGKDFLELENLRSNILSAKTGKERSIAILSLIDYIDHLIKHLESIKRQFSGWLKIEIEEGRKEGGEAKDK